MNRSRIRQIVKEECASSSLMKERSATDLQLNEPTNYLTAVIAQYFHKISDKNSEYSDIGLDKNNLYVTFREKTYVISVNGVNFK